MENISYSGYLFEDFKYLFYFFKNSKDKLVYIPKELQNKQ